MPPLRWWQRIIRFIAYVLFDPGLYAATNDWTLLVAAPILVIVGFVWANLWVIVVGVLVGAMGAVGVVPRLRRWALKRKKRALKRSLSPQHPSTK